MSRRSCLKKQKHRVASDVVGPQDERDIQFLKNFRRTKSYPEELLRDSLRRLDLKKLNEIHNNNGKVDDTDDIDDTDEVYFAKAYAHNKRLKSSGELQSALVTLAIRDGDVIQLWRLLGRKDVDINYMDGLGMQPIHYACLYGELEILKALLQYNVNINSPTRQGEYGLDIAVREGNFETAQYLVNKGARVKSIVNGITDKTNLNRKKSGSVPINGGKAYEL